MLQDVSVLSGGHSNLNLLLDFGAQKYVLRRPPLGHVMESAHNMEREYRALSALDRTPIPTPSPVALVEQTEETTGIETPFLVMEFVQASALSSRRDNAGRAPEDLATVSRELARIIATLHTLNPEAVGLQSFGRPEGYLARQMQRWSKQLEASRSRPTPALDLLLETLPEPPTSAPISIVHGDFKMNNALISFSNDNANVAAILDWEMATLGNPYADLAMFGVYWEMPDADQVIAEGFESPVDYAAGYPKFDELLGVYEEVSGRALPDMRWYRAFAAMKIAVITESLHFRHRIGAARGTGFEHMAAMTAPIARIGLDALAS